MPQAQAITSRGRGFMPETTARHHREHHGERMAMRRLTCATAAILTVVSATSLPARAETKLTVSSANLSLGHMVQRLAQSKGYFAAEGIKTEVFDFKGGGPAIQALVGGG